MRDFAQPHETGKRETYKERMKRIVITVSEYYLHQLNVVADELREEGMTITELYEYGVIVGLAAEETIERIRHHKEVAALTEEKEARIAPPDAEIQSLNGDESLPDAKHLP